MNYIKHSMAAHERLRHQPQARPHHVSLYWALFFEWNAARFPDELPLHREALMHAAHIGNKDTLTATLQALHEFGLIRYRPSRGTGLTRVVVVSLGGAVPPEVGQPTSGSTPGSGATETSAATPEVGQPVPPEIGQPAASVAPEVGKPSLVYETVDSNSEVNGSVAAGPKKNREEVFAGEGLSEVQEVPTTSRPPTPGATPRTAHGNANQVAPEARIKNFNGVGQGPQAGALRAAATAARAAPRPRGGRPAPLPELPFRESPIYDLPAFTAAFAGTDFALADLRHYHQLVDTWRDKKTGLPPTRKDWIATAKRFMLNDAADNRLKLAPSTQRPDPRTSPEQPVGSGVPVTGYRSKRWD